MARDSRVMRIGGGGAARFLVGSALHLRGAEAARLGRVLPSGEAQWILEHAWRDDAGFSIRQLADRVGIAETHLGRIGDIQLRQVIALGVERGDLLVVREGVPDREVEHAGTIEEAPAPPPPPRPRVPGIAEPEPEVPEVDVSAQVQTLRDAARSGVPFCEECEKALARSKAA